MNTRSAARVVEVLSLLPPFRAFSGARFLCSKLIAAHTVVMSVLYGSFIILAVATRMIWNEKGIGVIENPPFFAHLLATSASIPILVIVVRRLVSDSSTMDGLALQDKFIAVLGRSKLAWFLYGISVLVGGIALAASIVMANTFTIDVYDATNHVPTFVSYSAIRGYQYLICYPLLVAGPVTLAILYFLALRKTEFRYKPFDPDETGGLRRHLQVFDRPLYAVQTLTVLIALANYLGWGTMQIVPLILAIGAPTIVTGLAFALYFSFSRLEQSFRDRELSKIGEYQNFIYRQLLTDESERSKSARELIDELEANERLVALIRKRGSYGWVKYVVNYGVVLIPQVLDQKILTNLLSQFVAQSIGS